MQIGVSLIRLCNPPAHPLGPVKTLNTCPSCLTAAAGTGFAGAINLGISL